MRERDFFHTHLRPHLDMWGTYDRIENAVSQGIPDISYAIEGTQGWLEVKVAHPGHRLFFEEFQLPWLRRRARHTYDRGVFVIARDGDFLYLIRVGPLIAAPKEVKGRWTTVKIADISTPELVARQPWPWDIVRKILVSG